MLSAAIVVMILMTPALLEKVYHVSRVESLQANSLATLALAIGCVLAGWLTDRIGPARVLLMGCPLLGIAAYQLYATIQVSPAFLMPHYAVAGLTVGIVAVVPYVMIEAFPAQIRFTGVSLSYNVGYAIFGWTYAAVHIMAPSIRSYGTGPLCWGGLSAGFWSRDFSFFDKSPFPITTAALP